MYHSLGQVPSLYHSPHPACGDKAVRPFRLWRHLEWWNYVALPATAAVLGPGSRRGLLIEAGKAVMRVPYSLNVPAWLQQATVSGLKVGRA
ncbi:MAG: hypothetical protein JXA14_19330 [Anaerolineae bacterium]|nr:hypothetical protein [Anaerolineae bacterium]